MMSPYIPTDAPPVVALGRCKPSVVFDNNDATNEEHHVVGLPGLGGEWAAHCSCLQLSTTAGGINPSAVK